MRDLLCQRSQLVRWRTGNLPSVEILMAPNPGRSLCYDATRAVNHHLTEQDRCALDHPTYQLVNALAMRSITPFGLGERSRRAVFQILFSQIGLAGSR